MEVLVSEVVSSIHGNGSDSCELLSYTALKHGIAFPGSGGGGGGGGEGEGGTPPSKGFLAGWEARVAADPQFVYKVLVEQVSFPSPRTDRLRLGSIVWLATLPGLGACAVLRSLVCRSLELELQWSATCPLGRTGASMSWTSCSPRS